MKAGPETLGARNFHFDADSRLFDLAVCASVFVLHLPNIFSQQSFAIRYLMHPLSQNSPRHRSETCGPTLQRTSKKMTATLEMAFSISRSNARGTALN